MRIGQTSIVFFVSKVLGSIIGFLATVYFARVLGEEVLGFYALVLSIVTWSTVIGTVGFTGAITKRISEGTEQEQYATAGGITMGSIGLVVALGVLLFRDHVNAYVGSDVALFTAVIILASLSATFVYAVLQGYHLVHIYALLSTTRLGVRATMQVGLVVLGFSLSGLLVGYAVAAVVFTVVGLIILGFRPVLPQKDHFLSLFDFAKFSWLGSMRGKTFDQVDIIVLGFFVNAGLIGVYSVAWSIGKFLDIFSNAVSTTLFPEMSETAAQNDPEAVSRLMEDALAFGGLIIIPGFVGGIILADRIMQLYGDGFVVGKTVLPLLIASLLIYTYTKQHLNTLNAIDRPDLAFRANGAFIVSNVALNVVLVWQFGWLGAAVATALSAAVGLCFAYVYLRALVPFTVPAAEITRQWIAALCMGGVIYGIRRFGELNWEWPSDYNVAFVILLVTLGAAVYFSTLLLISSTFRTTVTNNLPFNVSIPGN